MRFRHAAKPADHAQASVSELPSDDWRKVAVVALVGLFVIAACATVSTEVRTGATAIDDDWKTDAPGGRRLIRPSDLPAPAK